MGRRNAGQTLSAVEQRQLLDDVREVEDFKMRNPNIGSISKTGDFTDVPDVRMAPSVSSVPDVRTALSVSSFKKRINKFKENYPNRRRLTNLYEKIQKGEIEVDSSFPQLKINTSKNFGDLNPTFADSGKPMINYTFDEIKLQKKLIDQTKLFWYHGNEKGKIPDYDIRFDYSNKGPGSGTGFGLTEEEKDLYKSSVKKLMQWQYKYLAGGDIYKMMNVWRYGNPKGEYKGDDKKGNPIYEDIKTADDRYYDTMIDNLGPGFIKQDIEKTIIDSLKKVK